MRGERGGTPFCQCANTGTCTNRYCSWRLRGGSDSLPPQISKPHRPPHNSLPPGFHSPCDCPWGACSARFFQELCGIQAPENPNFSLACRGMKAWSSRSRSFLSPWRCSRRSRIFMSGFLNGESDCTALRLSLDPACAHLSSTSAQCQYQSSRERCDDGL